jgi:putative FmdB family regulatory protein
MMPLYEYECRKCGRKFELMRTVGGRNRNAGCPACGSRRTERVITAPAVHFRGSGTYDSDRAPMAPASERPLPEVTDGGQR